MKMIKEAVVMRTMFFMLVRVVNIMVPKIDTGIRNLYLFLFFIQ